MHASRTSGPTSYESGPIAGPSHASSSRPGRSMKAMQRAMTPLASPRHPAWAMPTRVPDVSQSTTGRQSAVNTAHGGEPASPTLASARGAHS